AGEPAAVPAAVPASVRSPPVVSRERPEGPAPDAPPAAAPVAAREAAPTADGAGPSPPCAPPTPPDAGPAPGSDEVDAATAVTAADTPAVAPEGATWAAAVPVAGAAPGDASFAVADRRP
ncbi:MAG: hypothetical protein ACRDWN_04450, partial [Acidimicrobiales bacterium]